MRTTVAGVYVGIDAPDTAPHFVMEHDDGRLAVDLFPSLDPCSVTIRGTADEIRAFCAAILATLPAARAPRKPKPVTFGAASALAITVAAELRNPAFREWCEAGAWSVEDYAPEEVHDLYRDFLASRADERSEV